LGPRAAEFADLDPQFREDFGPLGIV